MTYKENYKYLLQPDKNNYYINKITLDLFTEAYLCFRKNYTFFDIEFLTGT